MRWKQVETGDKKIIKRFAFLPITIGNETRWLEWCTIELMAYDVDYYALPWRDNRFLN